MKSIANKLFIPEKMLKKRISEQLSENLENVDKKVEELRKFIKNYSNASSIKIVDGTLKKNNYVKYFEGLTQGEQALLLSYIEDKYCEFIKKRWDYYNSHKHEIKLFWSRNKD